MSRLLLLNCIETEAPREGFDQAIAPRLGGIFHRTRGGDVDLVHLADPARLPGPDRHSHLVLSGSELSAARKNPRDPELEDMIRAFVNAGRSVFGICYGHQMVARALCNHFCCRRAEVPEFGWKRVDLRPDLIMEGIPELVAVHSHYDEVFDLPEPFRVIASTRECRIQAFAYGDLPVWGTQFHPEQPLEEGTAMLRENLQSEPRARELFVDDLHDPRILRHNVRLFENFFRADPT